MTKLTEEKQEQIINWLDEKWKNRICECCGNRTWEMADNIVYSICALGGGYPNILVSCSNCSNTKRFDPRKIGVIDSADPMETQDNLEGLDELAKIIRFGYKGT